MQDKEDPLDRFEDIDDMFDFIVDKIQVIVRKWSVFSKISIEEEDGELSKHMLLSIVETEFDDQYPKTFPFIENGKNGRIVGSIIVERKRDNDLKRPEESL